MSRTMISEISNLSLGFAIRTWRREFMKRMSLDMDYDTVEDVEKVPGHHTSEISLLTFELSKAMRLIQELNSRIYELEEKKVSGR